jgi:hypothetical protein
MKWLCVYAVPEGFNKVWTSEPPTIALTEPVTILASEISPLPLPIEREEPVSNTPRLRLSAEDAQTLIDQLMYEKNVRWLLQEAEKLRDEVTDARFWELVKEEQAAKRLSEIEALHEVARENLEQYKAYRQASFIQGSMGPGAGD